MKIIEGAVLCVCVLFTMALVFAVIELESNVDTLNVKIEKMATKITALEVKDSMLALYLKHNH